MSFLETEFFNQSIENQDNSNTKMNIREITFNNIFNNNNNNKENFLDDELETFSWFNGKNNNKNDNNLENSNNIFSTNSTKKHLNNCETPNGSVPNSDILFTGYFGQPNENKNFNDYIAQHSNSNLTNPFPSYDDENINNNLKINKNAIKIPFSKINESKVLTDCSLTKSFSGLINKQTTTSNISSMSISFNDLVKNVSLSSRSPSFNQSKKKSKFFLNYFRNINK